MNFRDWLRQADSPKVKIEKEHEYYTNTQLLEDIESFDKFQRMIRSHELSNNMKYNLNWIEEEIHLNENIIEPHKLKINTTNIVKLNKEFNKYKIYFEADDYLHAFYKQESDEILVFVSALDDSNEIEAMVAHEMVHKEQNKRSNNNYFKQCKKMIDELNKMIRDKQKLITSPGGILVHRVEINELEVKIREKSLKFTHLNPYEEMAYACQAVLEYSKQFNKLNDIINYLLKEKFPVTSRFKKYLYMYWLIKDKIRGD